MKRSGSSGGLTVRAIAGTYTTLLGFDLTDTARKGCLGFSIARTEVDAADKPVGAVVWLRNRLRFPAETQAPHDTVSEEPVDFDIHASPPPPPPLPTTQENPWQAFRYVDSDVLPGHRYRYRIVARRGSFRSLEDGPAVTLTVSTEDTRDPKTAVFFNRAAASSQQYIERFGDLDPTDSPEARTWLSRGLEEGLLGFLAQATGSRHALHVAVYEFQKPSLLKALADARHRGAKVKAVYHGRRKDERDDTAEENEQAARAAGLTGCTKRRAAPTSAISHNKFVVLLEDGAPKAVWTGSTNWTDGALYGQLNVGHAVYDAKVAGAFEHYFRLLAEDKDGREIRASLDRVHTVKQVRSEYDAASGVWPIFSPQSSLEAITFYADVCRRARTLMVCAPFLLHETIRDALTARAKAKAASAQSFLLLDRPGNLGDKEHIDLLDHGAGTEVSVAVTLSDPLHDYQQRELMGRASFHHAGVHLHAKVILADPLGPSPTVITGSANYSESSTTDNDENTLVFRGDTAVADIYATEFMRVFDAYHFRGKTVQGEIHGRPLCLATDDRWSDRFYEAPRGDTDRASARRLFAGTDVAD